MTILDEILRYPLMVIAICWILLWLWHGKRHRRKTWLLPPLRTLRYTQRVPLSHLVRQWRSESPNEPFGHWLDRQPEDPS